MIPDFVYEKAPLVEVIVEIHWALKKLNSAPNAAIDPYYELFHDTFIEKCKDKLPNLEQLVPAEIPAEFVPNEPHLRLRPKSGGWPLVQIGPGVMTVNIVPPYNGWREFKQFIKWAFGLLYECYPMAEKTLRPQRTHLRYIDAFDTKYGLNGFAQFVGDHLGAARPIRPDVIDEIVQDPATITYIADSKFLAKSPADSTVRIRITPGKSDGREAVILELHCDKSMLEGFQTSEALLSWYDEAHATLRVLFDKTTSPDLKALFGNVVEINE